MEGSGLTLENLSEMEMACTEVRCVCLVLVVCHWWLPLVVGALLVACSDRTSDPELVVLGGCPSTSLSPSKLAVAYRQACLTAGKFGSRKSQVS